MAHYRQQLTSRAAARGKYAPLYRHLAALARPDWEVSFAEIESILGFSLPASARLHRPWWANQSRSGGHSHALAWKAAGWMTKKVDLDGETLVFQRIRTDSNAAPAGTRMDIARKAASNGKYAPLFRNLSVRTGTRWRATFAEIEGVLGFKLPDSARIHRPWWANQKRSGGHSHALAWQAAGWKTTRVDLSAETLVFQREDGAGAQAGQASPVRGFNLARDFPAVDMGPWPEGFKVSREEIYDELGRLVGGPEGDP